MQKYILMLILGFIYFNGNSQDFIRELKSSVEKNEAGAGDAVEYLIYLNPTNVKTYYARDYDKGVIVEYDGVPAYFELINMAGENSESVMINLKSASYMELELVKQKGKNKYKYKFYY